ncbi:hypothetical protein PHSY_001179 [Pseudozyma hubeiensis SY62]|uniref:Uncharacterized protein n=1 Tax=Pseudozyma hubeiensis (strain SY62) TaxID=1305764 RepID=R9NY62_PSEHS|nr:hypothetical protein PHSY_001179 [Pseudozyma hubeiensis SY62]GAC93614.1 hypothetical protein PHSY_001179 [Pseudozyma hubeiensis SY62]
MSWVKGRQLVLGYRVDTHHADRQQVGMDTVRWLRGIDCLRGRKSTARIVHSSFHDDTRRHLVQNDESRCVVCEKRAQTSTRTRFYPVRFPVNVAGIVFGVDFEI